MEQEEKKYERLISLLRKSKPVLESTDDIVENVTERINLRRKGERASFNILDYLFGWVYIGLVRKSLIAASVIIVALFAYQQTIIIKRINILSSQAVILGSHDTFRVSDDPEQIRLLNGLSGRKLRAVSSKITGKEIDKLLESINELQDKYKDLIKLIEDDPVLKKEIEKKLEEKKMKKFNL
jgi:DNA gyrase/topoisomerase IV subunit A